MRSSTGHNRPGTGLRRIVQHKNFFPGVKKKSGRAVAVSRPGHQKNWRANSRNQESWISLLGDCNPRRNRDGWLP